MRGRRLQLAIAIELIPKEIRHDNRSGRDFLDEVRQTGLVDLEKADRCREVPGPARPVDDRRRHAEHQVGAGLIGDRRMTLRLEDVPQQGRSGRLAIGPGDDDGAVAQRARELREDGRVDPARNVARERRAASAPQPATQARRQLAGPERRPAARSQFGAHQAATETGRQTQAG